MIVALDMLVGRIQPGHRIAIPPDYAGVAMAATRALLGTGTAGLKLLAVPTTGIQADLLIGAGRVAELEAAAVTLGEAGAAPRFAEAVRRRSLALRDSTCPAIHAALQASEKGVPFLPLRGLIGSDLVVHRPDWRIVDNPFQAGDPIVLLPAIRPDVALFHAPKADRDGNVWIGRRRELATMAHAAATALVTVETIVEGSLLADEATAAGVLPALYVGAVAQAERGAWPLGLPGCYEADAAELRRYAAAARTEAGFQAYLAGLPAAA